MNGRDEYKEKNKKRILDKISQNSDIKYLEDFYYFIAKKEPTTVYNYINYVICFMRSLNLTDPQYITFNSYNRYTSSISDKTQQYQIAVYSALKKFSTFLSINGVCKDYMQHVERPKNFEKQETKIKRENSVLSKNDIKDVFNNVLSSNKSDIWKQRDYVILLMFLTSGVRNSALYKMDVGDINFTTNTVVVTEKQDILREIIIPQQVIDEIKKWICYRNDLKPDTDALFISSQKKRMDTRSIYRIANKYASVNNKNGHPHIFRSTYITTVHEETGDLYTTQKSVGHANPKTTELYIRGIDTSIKERASDIMGKAVFGY